MELVTLKQFAKEKKISYEAVRKQIIKYADDLEEHIVIVDGTRYLDEYAQHFLSERRRLSPIVVKIEDAQTDSDDRAKEVESLRAELMQMQKRVIQLQDEARDALEEKIRYKLMLEDHEAMKRRLADSEADAALTREELGKARSTLDETAQNLRETERQLDEARREADSYERTWFGLYRKK